MGTTGTWAQVEDGKGVATVRWTEDTDLREELLVVAWQGREAQMRGGGRWVGVPPRWTVDPRPEDLGGEKWLQQESNATFMGGRWRSNRIQVQGGGTRYPETVETGGAGGV